MITAILFAEVRKINFDLFSTYPYLYLCLRYFRTEKDKYICLFLSTYDYLCGRDGVVSLRHL